MTKTRPSFTSSLRHCVTASLAVAAFTAQAQTWTPQRNVEIVVTSAPAGSNDRTARQVEKVLIIERLKKDPKSVASGFAVALGTHNHLAACLLVKALGGNARDLKAIAFKGSAEALTMLMGGHLDLATTAAGNAAPHVAAGRMRVVAAAAPARLGGALANVPTWREQGVDLVFGGWRSIMAPKGLSPAQIAFWEDALRKATQTPEWRTDLEKNYWSDYFVTGAQFRKNLDQEYADIKVVLTELGLAKQ